MPKGGTAYYAVNKGRESGVFLTWEECERRVRNFTGAKFKKFRSLEEANAFVGGDTSFLPKPTSTEVPRGSSPPADTSTDIADESGWDVVYCDGSCLGNGQLGSVAGSGVWWGHNDPRNLSERCPGAQTNNRAELFAIIRALQTTPHSKRPLLIKTDSKYSIKCFEEYLPKWRGNGFRLADGGPVKNQPIIRFLDALLDERARKGQKVRLQHVKGHSGIEGNVGADKLANLGAHKDPVDDWPWEALETNVRNIAELDAEEETVVADGDVQEDDHLQPLVSEEAVADSHAIDDIDMTDGAEPGCHDLPSDDAPVDMTPADLELYADGLVSDEELEREING